MGKIDSQELNHHAFRGNGDVHMVQPTAVSITQITESGTAYSISEIQEIGEICKKHNLKLHMDGARFANALVTLDCTPAEATWRAGVDVLSFGASKNGALASEAVIFFDKNLADEFQFRRKRGGHLFSKMRFLSCQMEAYLKNDLWMKNAHHANAMASHLYNGLNEMEELEFINPVEGNILFPRIPRKIKKMLYSLGFDFYDDRWEKNVIRLVTAFNTKKIHVEKFISCANKKS
jgi:threonine aldolase